MQYINISHKKIYQGIIYEASSENDTQHSSENIIKEEGFWCTKKKNSIENEFFIIDYKKEIPVNNIEISTSTTGKATFPAGFRIEGSSDGKYWKTIHSEKSIDLGDSTLYTLDIPITIIRFIKFLITRPKKIETKYFSEIGRFDAGIAGTKSISSSSFSKEHTTDELFDNRSDTYWESSPRQKSTREFIDIDLGSIFHLNRIALTSPNISPHGFPENFSIEISIDKSAWTPLFEEKNFITESSKKYSWDIDTIPVRYVHIEMKGKSIENGNYGVRLSEFEIFASTINAFHTHNIGDISPYASTFQAGLIRLAKDGEDFSSTAVQGNDSRLRDATTIFKGIVQLSEDGDNKKGLAIQASDSRLKDATELKQGIVRLAKDMESKPELVVQGNDSRLKEATEQNFGIVKLCSDGVDSELGVVKGNDSRLQKATTASYGICRLADDGENNPDCTVQGNDKRLRDASTTFKGIAELADNGENKAGVVVQGNDKRLKDATTSSKGIVELADDGEDKEGVVVQGNDKRLKDASTAIKGIMKFANDGEDNPFAAVQGNDKRLKDATTTYKGIVELAEDGEDKDGVAVQGNDKRLKDASTTTRGIVELAENGEDREGVAVQGNDKRLCKATEDEYGIVRIAKDEESRKGFVVQSHDSRLSDARPSLPHNHNYAPVTHEFNSHTGTIKIIDKKNEKLSGIVPPNDESAIIFAKNESSLPGAIGITGIASPLNEKSKNSYGVLGHSRFIGVRGQSNGNPEGETKGCGMLGVSKFGAGGVFASEHSYSIIADGYAKINEFDDSLNLNGNGDALYVNGKSEFTGKIHIKNRKKDNKYPINIVEMFEIDEDQYIMPGDLLIASEKGESILTRAVKNYSTSVIGIVSHNPSVIINNSGVEKKVYPIVLTGKALCRVDARVKPVKPGDLIVTSDTPGCGMAGEIDSFSKIGSVIGKALNSINNVIGVIPIFIMHQ